MGYMLKANTHLGESGKFSISVSGAETVHFDAFTLNLDGTIGKFAPFSHDAETVVPEPATLLLLGLGLAGSGVIRKLRK